MCQVCERADDRENNGVDESIDLGNGVHLEKLLESFVIWGILYVEPEWSDSPSVAILHLSDVVKQNQLRWLGEEKHAIHAVAPAGLKSLEGKM